VIESAAVPSPEGMIEGDPIEAERVRGEVRARLFGGAAPVMLIGKFELGKRLGIGAMGVVYQGRDPELARTVAIKLLLDRGPASELRREAQALARLRHPNVVAVHEIGAWRELPFVAMEHVDGVTVREWLAIKERDWHDVIAVFAGAGRGLAAAHDADLVHRDFKPDNVLVDRRGDARVVDFGLARIVDDVTGVRVSGSATARGTIGAVAGTPAYMAPEVQGGAPATALSDQYSFGVALHEALAKKRDRSAKLAGVPRGVASAIEKCLAKDPKARFADMHEVVDAIDPTGKSVLPVFAAALALPITAILVVYVFAGRGDRDGVRAPVIDPCASASAPISAVWNPQRASAIGQAFAGTKLAYAGAAAESSGEIIGGYVSRWGDAAARACRAPSAMRAACLDDRRRELAALVERFATADERTVEKAVAAASALPAVEICDETGELAERVPPPQDPAVAAKIATLRDRLATARIEVYAGHAKDVMPELRALATESDGIAYAPLAAEAHLVLGLAAIGAAEHEAAVPALERAYREGLAGRHDPVAADAAIKLANLLGDVQGKVPEGRRWLADAEALVRRTGSAHELVAWHHNVTGNVEQTAGNYDVALAAFARAEAAWRESRGDHRIDIAGAVLNAGNTLVAQGKSTEALPMFREAVATWTSALGPDHPLVQLGTTSLTSALRDLGRFEDALALDTEVLRKERARVGDEHPDVAFARGTLANDLRGLGKFTEALDEYRLARAVFAAKLGADHRIVAATDGNIGGVLVALGRYAEAEPALLAALAGKEKRGPKHPSLISTLDALGNLELRRGKPAAAKRHFQRSFEIGEVALGPDSPDLADSISGLGEVALVERRPETARALLERALALRTKSGTPTDLALIRFPLGRSLWELGDRGAGHAHVVAAAALLERAPTNTYERAAANAWLAAHPAP